MVTKSQIQLLMEQLIAIPSVNGTDGVDKCAEFIVGWFKEAGITAEIVKNNGVANVVASIGKKGKKRVLWNGHFDVVPQGDLSDWNTEPFTPVEKDGYIIGRGSSDMKSGIAAMMLAMKDMVDCGTNLDGEIVFWGIGDEETGSEHGTVQMLRERDNTFDAAIVSEPTDLCLEIAQRGLRWIKIHVKGKAAHAGRPHLGKNAIEQSAKIIEALKNISYDVYNPLFEEGLEKPSLSVNKIIGGIQNNVVAEECSFIIDRRMLPGENAETVMNQIKAACDSVKMEGFEISCCMLNNGWDPFVIDQNEPILTLMKKYYTEVIGCEPVIRGKGGCTDASHIYNEQIPVVIFGPGNANEAHTANEKVFIDNIEKSVEIISKATIEFL